ncbi:MAG: NADH-quinone oxidoreductase subunit L [Acidobacteriota bacterium]|nr:MAG: NADH-quinone oxidoreductase subunit L [Acidobacteriota bacterium]
MLETFWILLLFPLVGAAINGIFGKRFSPGLIATIGCGSVFISFAIALLTFFELLGLAPADRAVTNHLFTWIESGNFVANASFLFDPLSGVMILVVTGVGFLIHLYSVEYMRGETGYYRFFAYLNLFIFMMSTLVLADNYLLMFVGWEGVGLCSYLLIGYYFETRVAGDAAKKAFIVNRIGDFGFLLGMFLIFQTFGTLEYHSLFSTVAERFPAPEIGFGVLSGITLLLFLGATGKSAQIPLYVWLPDAMAGPTPVSALIHAATMVTAGVYMIARSATLYSRAPESMLIVAVIGIVTALVAALIAIAQRDIKKVLAYSTVSQLGYMFLAVGVGAWASGIFHLYTHAFFKALLFLGSGSVILAMHHEQDMLKMGGLKKYLPITWATMGVATLAIAGIPPFAGFFSKDEILWNSLVSGHGHLLLWVAGVLVAALTAFYMARLMYLTFYGKERFSHESHGHHDDHDHHHSGPPKEPSLFVTLPLMILGVLSAIAGLVGLPAWLGDNRFEHFLEPVFHYAYTGDGHQGEHSHSLEIGLTVVIVTLALISIFLAYRFFVKNPAIPERIAERFAGIHKLLWNKFYVDEVYDALIVWPIERISRFVLWKGIDVGIIDGAVNGVASLMQGWSNRVKRLQSGYARAYASWILFGAVLIFLYYYLAN